MNKRIIYIIGILITIASCASAQGVVSFKHRLMANDSMGVRRITITEHGNVAQIINSLSARTVPDKIKGYRVRIFFDNSQTARSNAEAMRKQFVEAFPEVPVYMNYENPYFKVTVGNCATVEEAIILWGRIKETFRKAFVIREDIPMESFKIEVRSEPVQ